MSLYLRLNRPCIATEVKGYGATGSKMTDIIDDLDATIDATRPKRSSIASLRNFAVQCDGLKAIRQRGIFASERGPQVRSS